jgi:pilus assembly protein FimV
MRVKPWITGSLMAGVAALPASALALGLGRLTVDSGLGQPLSARVELTAAQKDEIDTLQAKVAEPSVYRDNNVQYPPGVARARVTVEQGPNNTYFLRVATPQALNEPFLDLIVEVNWATGRVVRNYTFLLDPPGASDTQQAVEPVSPVRAAERAPARRAAAEPVAGPRAGAGENSYTVKRGDTLSKIAKEYKPADVTLEQMLVALFRSNEAAFDGRNMNRLRAGQILAIPPSEQPGLVGQTEAKQVVRVQAADWRAYRDRVAAAAPTTEAAPTQQAAGGKITTAVEEKGAPTQAGKDQLKVSREAGKGGGAGVAQAEDAAAKDRALREANSRIADLEATLKNMQKATELKSSTLAGMQKQAETTTKGAKAGESAKTETATPSAPAPEARAPTAPAPAAQEPVVAPTAQAPALASAAQAPAVAAAPSSSSSSTLAPSAPDTKTTEAKATEAAETKSPEPAVVASATDTRAQDAKAAETKSAAQQAKATKAKAPAPAPPSFFDDLFANTPNWMLIGAPLVLLGGIAAIFVTRRRKTTKFEDSIISGTDIKTNTVFGSTGGGVVNTGDNSLASDFSREGLGNIDTDEVDPIAEAEVYLAYGRDAQAEEILKEALKKDPQRQEIYLKLLEIHAQHNKPSAFETVASELYSVSGGQGEVWQKAMALGRQLDPNNPMFTEAGSAAAFAAAVVEPKQPAPDEPGEPTVPATAAEAPAAAAAPEPHVGRSVDFTLDDEISLSPTSAVAPDAKTPAAILAGAAEQVAKSTRTAAVGASAAAVAGATALAKSSDGKRAAPREDVSFEPESVPKFDLDFNLDEPSKPGPPMSTPITSVVPPKPASAPRPAAPEPALAAVGAGAPAPQLARPAAAIELDKLDLAFDPQRSTFEDPTPSVLDGQWHDAATKLDLAKAYQEMGDVEGAREILQEVLHEGDDQQKAEAQGLLAKLA